ncbi:hypothetical protein [Flavimaricola marinus]|uniref:Uncharacterized protein n=1 Tax=Flavimaricola marinus TaxID=1819565 RepID=A0A238LI58_9RHOB|nr:hypothetical protein [Flavimaricola marinus]SMY09369.1 hypothetical protein LOM8899_03535 [Flavimaricola marinus]
MYVDLAGKTLSAAAFAACVCFAAPGAAQTFDPPQGCDGVLTVQSRSCLVIHTWTCEADAPGEQWMALFTDRGPYNVRKIDAEFQWLETHFADPPAIEQMQVPAPDPESISVLLAEDHDTYDFTITNDRGTPDERVRGYDSLTGESVVIDGEPLLRTEFAYEVTLPDGTVQYRGAGAQFLSERHRLFLLGLSWSQDTPDEVNDASPVEFIYPGEPGFFSARPKYDCGGVLSKAAR